MPVFVSLRTGCGGSHRSGPRSMRYVLSPLSYAGKAELRYLLTAWLCVWHIFYCEQEREGPVLTGICAQGHMLVPCYLTSSTPLEHPQHMLNFFYKNPHIWRQWGKDASIWEDPRTQVLGDILHTSRLLVILESGC